MCVISCSCDILHFDMLKLNTTCSLCLLLYVEGRFTKFYRKQYYSIVFRKLFLCFIQQFLKHHVCGIFKNVFPSCLIPLTSSLKNMQNLLQHLCTPLEFTSKDRWEFSCQKHSHCINIKQFLSSTAMPLK